VFDSTIILEYIEERWPEPRLLPATPAERARARMIEEVMDTQYEAINWGIMEVRAFKRASGDLADGLLARAREQTQQLQGWLARELGAREWFNGVSFGWADLSVLPYLNGSVVYGNGPAPECPLGRWFTRASARPSAVAVFEAAKAAGAGLRDRSEAIKSGLIRREYRDHRLEWMMKSGGRSIVLKGLEENTIRFQRELG
jgi:glutathione S-transferase